MLHASVILSRTSLKFGCSAPMRSLTYTKPTVTNQCLARMARTHRPLQVSFIPALQGKTIAPTVAKTMEDTLEEQPTKINVSPATNVVVAASKTFSVSQALPRLLLTSASAAMASTFLYCNGLGVDSAISVTEMVEAMGYNIPISAACAALGDLAAQAICKWGPPKQKCPIDVSRSIAAGSIAGMLQGVGTTVWIAHLNILLPGSSVGFDSLSKAAMLGVKVVVDSWVWGTLLNTMNICMRRTAAGDSLEEAGRKWSKSIIGVTAFEFKFWPVWGSAVYAYLPVADQVAGFAVGGFLWSIYLSLISSGAQADSTIHRRLAWYGRPVGCRYRTSSSYGYGGAHAALHKASSSGLVLASSASRAKVQKNKYVAAVSTKGTRPSYRILRQDLKGAPRSGKPKRPVSRSTLTL